MSGLNVFFQSFLPSESSSFPTYEESTAEAGADTVTATTEAQAFTEPLSYSEWKKLSQQVLETYLTQRLLVTEEDEESSEEKDTAEEEKKPSPKDPSRTRKPSAPPEEDEESPEWETQGFALPREENSDGEDATPPRPPRTPHVEEAIHTVQYLTDVNLFTKSAQLQLLKIEQTVMGRKTNRPSVVNVVPRPQALIPVHQGPIKVPLSPCVDDGPLACVYRYVLSLYVTQIDKPKSTLRLKAAAAMLPSLAAVRRMQVFLYNTYGQALQNLMDSHETSGDDNWILSLPDVPARCVFPLPPPSSWERADIAPYALGIGDNSMIKTSDGDAEGSPKVSLRFDADIRVGLVCQNRVEQEWWIGIDADKYDKKVVCRPATDGVMAALWAEHRPALRRPFAPDMPPTQEEMEEARRNSPPEKSVRTVRTTAGTLLATAPEVHSPLVTETRVTEESQPEAPNTTTTTTTEVEIQEPPTERKSAVSSHESHCMEEDGEKEMDATEAPATQTAPEEGKVGDETTAPPAEDKQRDGDTNKEDGNALLPTRTEAQHDSDTENEPREETPNQSQTSTTTAPLSPVNDRRVQAFRIIQEVRTGSSPSRNASPSRSKEKATLHYHQLGDLREHLTNHIALSAQDGGKAGGCVVNIMAVVLGFGCPFLTRRGEWMMAVALVDETIPLDHESMDDSVQTVNINIFSKDKSYLPKIRYAGDVLRMHRVQLQEWNGELQLMGLRASSYVVCRREVMEDGSGGDWTLLPTSKSHFEVSDLEKKMFSNLWEWGQRRLETFPTMKISKSFKLSDIQRQHSEQVPLYNDEESTGDLTVMVTSIIPRQSEMSHYPLGFLRVWDGTGVPVSDPLFNFNEEALESVADGDPPAKVLIRIAKLLKKLQSRRSNQEPMLEPYAVTGRVVNVAVWETSHWELVKEVVQIGTFIRLRNVQDRRMPESDLRCLMVHSKSYMTPLPELTYEVVKLLENHNARLERSDEPNPSSGLLPLESDEEDTPPQGRDATPRTRDNISLRRRSPKRRKMAESSQGEFSSLISANLPIKFTGIVNITGTIPSFPSLASGKMAKIIHNKQNFAVKLEDSELNQVDAIVNGGSEAAMVILGGEAVFSGSQVEFATSFLRTAIKKRWKWVADIRSVFIDGAKYFVLDGIQKCDGATATV